MKTLNQLEKILEQYKLPKILNEMGLEYFQLKEEGILPEGKIRECARKIFTEVDIEYGVSLEIVTKWVIEEIAKLWLKEREL